MFKKLKNFCLSKKNDLIVMLLLLVIGVATFVFISSAWFQFSKQITNDVTFGDGIHANVIYLNTPQGELSESNLFHFYVKSYNGNVIYPSQEMTSENFDKILPGDTLVIENASISPASNTASYYLRAKWVLTYNGEEIDESLWGSYNIEKLPTMNSSYWKLGKDGYYYNVNNNAELNNYSSLRTSTARGSGVLFFENTQAGLTLKFVEEEYFNWDFIYYFDYNKLGINLKVEAVQASREYVEYMWSPFSDKNVVNDISQFTYRIDNSNNLIIDSYIGNHTEIVIADEMFLTAQQILDGQNAFNGTENVLEGNELGALYQVKNIQGLNNKLKSIVFPSTLTTVENNLLSNYSNIEYIKTNSDVNLQLPNISKFGYTFNNWYAVDELEDEKSTVATSTNSYGSKYFVVDFTPIYSETIIDDIKDYSFRINTTTNEIEIVAYRGKEMYYVIPSTMFLTADQINYGYINYATKYKLDIEDITFATTNQVLNVVKLERAGNLTKGIVVGSNIAEISDGAFDKCTSIEYLQTLSNSTTFNLPTLTKGYTIAQWFYFNQKKGQNTLTNEGTRVYNTTDYGQGYYYVNWYNKTQFNIANSISEYTYYVTPQDKIVITSYIGENILIEIPSTFTLTAEQYNAGKQSYYEEFGGDEPVEAFTTKTLNVSKVVGLNSILEQVVLPEGITEISENLFAGGAIKSVTIPSTITTIENGAFANCLSLTTLVNIENSNLQTIGPNAFNQCTALTEIQLPSTVQTISDYAFYNCLKLTTTGLEENSNVTSIGNYAFLSTAITEIYISAETTNIGTYAFNSCDKLRKVKNLQNTTLTEIKPYTFFNCKELYFIELPNTLKTINNYAFKGCENIEKFTVTSILEYIGIETFCDCINLKIIEGLELSKITSIPEKCFANCNSIEIIDYPSTVRRIDSYAFKSCYSLDYLEIKENVITIEDNIIQGCAGLKLVNYAADLGVSIRLDRDENNLKPNINYSGYYGSKIGLISRSYANAGMFSYFDPTYTVGTISEYEEIDGKLWATQIKINSENRKVIIPSFIIFEDGGTYTSKMVYGIKATFNQQEDLIPFFVDNNGNDISNSIENVLIHPGITEIGEYAFYNCSNLENIDFCNTIRKINNNAIISCNKIEDIKLKYNTYDINSNAIHNLGAVEMIYIPNAKNLNINLNNIRNKSWYLFGEEVNTATTNGLYDTTNSKVASSEDWEFEIINHNAKNYAVVRNYLGSAETVLLPLYIKKNNIFYEINYDLNNHLKTIQTGTIQKLVLNDNFTTFDFAIIDRENNITELEFSNTITTLKNIDISYGNDFNYLKNVTTFTNLENTSITEFNNVFKVGEIHLPDTCESFINKSDTLETLIINQTNTNFILENGILYNPDKSTIICALPSVKQETIDLTNVTLIKDYALYYCTLEYLIIPSTTFCEETLCNANILWIKNDNSNLRNSPYDSEYYRRVQTGPYYRNFYDNKYHRYTQSYGSIAEIGIYSTNSSFVQEVDLWNYETINNEVYLTEYLGEESYSWDGFNLVVPKYLIDAEQGYIEVAGLHKKANMLSGIPSFVKHLELAYNLKLGEYALYGTQIMSFNASYATEIGDHCFDNVDLNIILLEKQLLNTSSTILLNCTSLEAVIYNGENSLNISLPNKTWYFNNQLIQGSVSQLQKGTYSLSGDGFIQKAFYWGISSGLIYTKNTYNEQTQGYDSEEIYGNNITACSLNEEEIVIPRFLQTGTNVYIKIDGVSLSIAGEMYIIKVSEGILSADFDFDCVVELPTTIDNFSSRKHVEIVNHSNKEFNGYVEINDIEDNSFTVVNNMLFYFNQNTDKYEFSRVIDSDVISVTMPEDIEGYGISINFNPKNFSNVKLINLNSNCTVDSVAEVDNYYVNKIIGIAGATNAVVRTVGAVYTDLIITSSTNTLFLDEYESFTVLKDLENNNCYVLDYHGTINQNGNTNITLPLVQNFSMILVTEFKINNLPDNNASKINLIILDGYVQLQKRSIIYNFNYIYINDSSYGISIDQDWYYGEPSNLYLGKGITSVIKIPSYIEGDLTISDDYRFYEKTFWHSGDEIHTHVEMSSYYGSSVITLKKQQTNGLIIYYDYSYGGAGQLKIYKDGVLYNTFSDSRYALFTLTEQGRYTFEAD